MLHLVIITGGVLASAAVMATKKLHQRRNPLGKTLLPPDTKKNTDADVQKDQEKHDVDNYIKVSAASIGFALVGEFLYPPLVIPAVAMLLYSSVPVFKSAGKALSKGKVKASLVDSIAITGGLVTHYYVASGVATLVYFSAIKLMMATEDKSKSQLGNIFGKQPLSVWLLQEGAEKSIPFESLKVGDTIVLHAGEMIPIDGIITGGYASIDQHALTGESQPAEKGINASVLAGTIVVEGRVEVQVEQCGSETVAAKIGDILQHTADFRSSVEAKSIHLSDQLALPTLALGGVALATLGPVSGIAIVSCNFSEIIRIVAPLGVLNFLKLATETGILIKDGRSLELLSNVDTVVFDKTGTLTLEQPHVGGLNVWGELDEDTLLRLAAAAEHKQTHPIARAIIEAAEAKKLELPLVDHTRYEIGYGIKVELEQKTVLVGSHRFMLMQAIELPPVAEEIQQRCHENGHSLVYVAVDGLSVGAVELHSTIRPEAVEVLRQLRQQNLRLCIISGDQEKPTRHLAQLLGIDDYFAETLPENKAQLIEKLQQEGRSVCFIGDGINDTIALKKANVSISLQGASTAATDTAGIILMDKNLTQLPHLFKLAKGMEKNMRKSFASALIPGVVGVVGVFWLHFGIYSALLLYVTSLAAGVTNSMTPLLKYSKNKKQTDMDNDSPT